MEPKTYIHTDSIVKAVQYVDSTSIPDIRKWVVESGGALSLLVRMSEDDVERSSRTAELIIDGPKFGAEYVRQGDWVTKANGSFKAESAERFARRYELINSPTVPDDTAVLVRPYSHKGVSMGLALQFDGSVNSFSAVVNFLSEYQLLYVRLMQTEERAIEVIDTKPIVTEYFLIRKGDWVLYTNMTFSRVTNNAFHDRYTI